jgi:hypothetical protein
MNDEKRKSNLLRLKAEAHLLKEYPDVARKLKESDKYDHMLDQKAELALQILQQAQPEELKSSQTEELGIVLRLKKWNGTPATLREGYPGRTLGQILVILTQPFSDSSVTDFVSLALFGYESLSNDIHYFLETPATVRRHRKAEPIAAVPRIQKRSG